MIIQRTPARTQHTCAVCTDAKAQITITFNTVDNLHLCNHCYRDLAYLTMHWDGVSRLSSVTRKPEKP